MRYRRQVVEGRTRFLANHFFCRPGMVDSSRHHPGLLPTNLTVELLVQDITEPIAVLGSLSGDDLQNTSDYILDQFALVPLISAHESSRWSDSKRVIACNRGSIHRLQAAFYAGKLEVQRRKTVVRC